MVKERNSRLTSEELGKYQRKGCVHMMNHGQQVDDRVLVMRQVPCYILPRMRDGDGTCNFVWIFSLHDH